MFRLGVFLLLVCAPLLVALSIGCSFHLSGLAVTHLETSVRFVRVTAVAFACASSLFDRSIVKISM